MSLKTVTGIDVGTRKAGYCSIETEGQDLQIRRLESFTVYGETIADRLDDMASKLSMRLELDDPDLIAVEDGYVGRNPRTSLVIGMARGVAVFVAQTTTLASIELVDPSEARKAVGAAVFAASRLKAKVLVKEAVERILRPQSALDDDMADAAALAVWAAGRVWQVQKRVS